MTNLENIIEHYRPLVEEAVSSIDSGVQYKFYDTRKWVFWDTDMSARVQAVFDMMYETIRELKKQDVSLLPKIAIGVSNPVIDDVLDFMEKEGDFDNAKQRFIEKLSELHTPQGELRGAPMKTLSSIRAYLFLEVMRRHPEKINRIEQNSVYFPHRLFLGPTSKRSDVEREVAAAVPSLYSEKLLGIVTKLKDLIESTNTRRRERLGKYLAQRGFTWKKGIKPLELDLLFSPSDIKKEIFYTLAEYFALVWDATKEVRISPRDLPNLRIPDSHYGIAVEAIRAYARNQMLYVFKATDGKAFSNTFIARCTHLSARIDGDVLVVYDDYHKSTERLTVDSSYRDTQTNLPFCAFLLNKIYWKAQEINAKPTS